MDDYKDLDHVSLIMLESSMMHLQQTNSKFQFKGAVKTAPFLL